MRIVADLTRDARVISSTPGAPSFGTSLVNLTGRTIVLCAPDGEPLHAFPPSDRVARAGHVFTTAAAGLGESAVLAVLLLKERMSRRAALGVGCSVLGTVLLVL